MWKIKGASVVGGQHQAAGMSCADSWGFAVLDDQAVVLAIADGAGSATFGAEGSRVASGAAVQYVESAWGNTVRPYSSEEWRQLVSGAVRHSRTTLDRHAIDLEISVGALATTLILVVLSESGAAVCQVGDGAVVVERADGELFTFARPTNYEYPNITDFVTSDDFEANLQLSVLRVKPAGIAMFTDGLQDLALRTSGYTPHAGFFRPVFRYARNDEESDEGLQRFLESDRVRALTGDDVTLLLATV